MTYWEKFENLCGSIGKKPNPVGKEIGVSSSTITKWKNGAIPNGEILLSVANYFNCSIDYLLGRTDQINSTRSVNGDNTQAVSNGNNSPVTFVTEKAQRSINNKAKEPDIRRIERARKNMPFQEWERMMNIVEAAFPEYFDENFIDEDTDE